MAINLENIQKKIQNNIAVALYITTENCGICDALKPKLFPFLSEKFPALKVQEIQTKLYPEIPAYYGVFTVPTLLVFLDGKKYLRKSRAFGLNEIAEAISRPYNMIFEVENA